MFKYLRFLVILLLQQYCSESALPVLRCYFSFIHQILSFEQLLKVTARVASLQHLSVSPSLALIILVLYLPLLQCVCSTQGVSQLAVSTVFVVFSDPLPCLSLLDFGYQHDIFPAPSLFALSCHAGSGGNQVYMNRRTASDRNAPLYD